MGSACGVSWDGTSSGELDESEIPNDDYESHYLNDADTKSESSFPVVDAEGNLRAGNVNSAWDLRNQGEGVSEECLRELDSAFDENVLPESAYENASSRVRISEDADTEFGINVEFAHVPERRLGDGFNEYGVRQNEDGSVDARFKIMEPGERNGVEITADFLQEVASKSYGRLPVQLDHSKNQRANVGYVRGENITFTGDYLAAQVHIPNTGSSVRDDIIADFTHEPPQIQDGSIGLDPQSVEVDAPAKRGEPPEFTDGRLREISLTPFPAGYDNGGLTPEFSTAVEKASVCPCNFDDTKSQLIERPHILIEK